MYEYTYIYIYVFKTRMRAPWPSHAKVRAAVNKTIAQIASWSIRAATAGVAPAQDFDGQPFPKDSDRARMAGTQLANGWRPLVIY